MTTEKPVLVHRNYKRLFKAMQMRGANGLRKNIFLSGPMGGGKTSAIERAATQLGLPYSYTGQVQMAQQIVGYENIHTGDWVQTAFTRAFINGGVFAAEEMDAWGPNASIALNVPLANGYISAPNGDMFPRHADFVLVACANTWGHGATAEYVGRNKMDAATLDRFGVRIDWPYDGVLERKIVNNNDVVDFVQTCRNNAKKHGLKVGISPRSSIDIADMVEAGFTMKEAAEMNFLAGLDDSQVKRLIEGVEYALEEDDDLDALPFAGIRRRV